MTAPSATFRRLALACSVLALGATATLTTAPLAAARSSDTCWNKLIQDWYDGRIDHTYPVHCYKEALRHLPPDVKTYSNAVDMITRALADVTRGKKHVSPNAPVPPPTSEDVATVPTTTAAATTTTATTTTSAAAVGGGKGGGGNGGADGGSSAPSGPYHAGTPKAGGPEASGGPIGSVLNKGNSRADSIPIPLIVLGGLAVLLVAAGAAGLIARRVQGRRARP